MRVFFACLAIWVVCSSLLNRFRLQKTLRYYDKFLTNKNELKYSGAEIEYLWRKAGINKVFAFGKYAGENVAYYVANGSYENEIETLFCSAISIYRLRIKNTFNPLFWITFPGTLVQSHTKKQVPAIAKWCLNIIVWGVDVIASHRLEELWELGAFHRMIKAVGSIL